MDQNAARAALICEIKSNLNEISKHLNVIAAYVYVILRCDCAKFSKTILDLKARLNIYQSEIKLDKF